MQDFVLLLVVVVFVLIVIVVVVVASVKVKELLVVVLPQERHQCCARQRLLGLLDIGVGQMRSGEPFLLVLFFQDVCESSVLGIQGKTFCSWQKSCVDNDLQIRQQGETGVARMISVVRTGRHCLQHGRRFVAAGQPQEEGDACGCVQTNDVVGGVLVEGGRPLSLSVVGVLLILKALVGLKESPKATSALDLGEIVVALEDKQQNKVCLVVLHAAQ